METVYLVLSDSWCTEPRVRCRGAPYLIWDKVLSSVAHMGMLHASGPPESDMEEVRCRP